MKVDVLHIAKLANLQVKKEELEKYQKQLSSILDYVDELKQLPTENVSETSQTTGLENVKSEDIPSPSLSQDEALNTAKNKKNGLFKTKAIFE